MKPTVVQKMSLGCDVNTIKKYSTLSAVTKIS